MKLCRFSLSDQTIRIGLVTEDKSAFDLTASGITSISELVENANLLDGLRRPRRGELTRFKLSEVRLLAPVDRQEVWAAGVTYLRSKKARMEESDFSATAYDKVYEAERPELFFKSLPDKVVGPGERVGIRKDARWSVPEPELALVISSRAQIVGYTIGNDMSSRDIEGENLLYLPQAKIYRHSCALGPWIVMGPSEEEARNWTIQLTIEREGKGVFSGETSVSQIKRRFQELAEFLFRSQAFPFGAVLLTGTGIVPPDTFTLVQGDRIRIEISGIGVLENTAELV